MPNRETFSPKERPQTWTVGRDTRWRRGFGSIGSNTDLYGPLGSSGMLESEPRSNARKRDDGEDTLGGH